METPVARRSLLRPLVPSRTVSLLALLGLLTVAAGVLLGYTLSRDQRPIGQWQTTDKAESGVPETVTYEFLPDGLFTWQNKTDQGTLMHGNGAAAFSDVRRMNVHGAYTIKADVLTCKIAGVSLYGDQGQPVSLPNGTHNPEATYRFKMVGDRLTLDGLDGTPPIVLVRQHSQGE